MDVLQAPPTNPTIPNINVPQLPDTDSDKTISHDDVQSLLSRVEHCIHIVEMEAYTSVLRAFLYKSIDNFTQDKLNLIVGLMKEFNISYEEHKKLLDEVNSDQVLHSIRELRSFDYDSPQRYIDSLSLSSPTVSASPEMQDTSQEITDHKDGQNGQDRNIGDDTGGKKQGHVKSISTLSDASYGNNDA